jgi:hypothetical protein
MVPNLSMIGVMEGWLKRGVGSGIAVISNRGGRLG